MISTHLSIVSNIFLAENAKKVWKMAGMHIIHSRVLTNSITLTLQKKKIGF